MIEPMKHVTVICLADERGQTVHALADLGIVHVCEVRPPQSDDIQTLSTELEQYTHALNVLQARKTVSDGALEEPPAPPDIVSRTIKSIESLHQNHAEIARLRTAEQALEPWGSYRAEQLALLRRSGLVIHFCAAAESDLPALPEGAALEIVRRRGKQVYFVVVAPAELELPEALPHVFLPAETDLAEIRTQIRRHEEEIAAAEQELNRLAPAVPAVASAITQLRSRLTLLEARDGMGEASALAYLQGYVPRQSMDRLTQAAAQHGWALQTEDADGEDTRVPTLLRLPRIFRLAKPVFQFIGILPGYHEPDVSISVLIFLCIFFGMIVGDAGYGLLFLTVALFAKFRIRDPRRQLPINLFLVLSVVTIVWGGLTGTWLAVPAEKLPAWMQGWDWLTDEASRNRHIQWLCFLLAAIHLSLARGWQAFLRIPRLAALGQIGWALLIWGNFFTAVELIVDKGSFPRFVFLLYAVGVVLVLAFGVKWRDMGDVFNLPFGLIGSFVDLLSYIRLFAVGLSSYFIAYSFNNMGAMIVDLSPWLFPAAALVVLFGHLLNIALAFMGVLVHGVRLNTLEFSNHMGITWSGLPFRPLRKAPDAG